MSPTFDELIASRKQWIETVLKPWCRTAPLKDLKRAELEWGDIAGRVDPQATLWTWAWSRFPALVYGGLSGVDETHEVRVTLADGTSVTGFPDNRRTKQGNLVLLCVHPHGETDVVGPLSIDHIAEVERIGR